MQDPQHISSHWELDISIQVWNQIFLDSPIVLIVGGMIGPTNLNKRGSKYYFRKWTLSLAQFYKTTR